MSVSALYWDNQQTRWQLTLGHGDKSLTNRELDRFLSSVEKHGFRMAAIATGDEEEAYDILQDTMIKLVQKYAGRPEHEWQALFYRILQSRIRDWYRRMRVKNRVFTLFAGAEDIIESDKDPALLMEGEATETILMECIKRLPIQQQQVFLLRSWQGMNVAETALAMRISAGSVKTHYSRAISVLRNALED